MGIRHLIIIYHDGQYKLAQYGQLDGKLQMYPARFSSPRNRPLSRQHTGGPESQGARVLKFLSDPDNLTKLVANLDKIQPLTTEEYDKFVVEVEGPRWEADARLQQAIHGEIQVTDQELAELKRVANTCNAPTVATRTSAGILDIIANADKPVPVLFELNYIGDRGCEWAYVIDIDAGVLEVYAQMRWMIKKGATRFHEFECGRCGKMRMSCVSGGPGLAGTWSLRDLPSVDGFVQVICNAIQTDYYP